MKWLDNLIGRIYKKKPKVKPEDKVIINIIEKETRFVHSYKDLIVTKRTVKVNNFTYHLANKGMILEPTKEGFVQMYVFNEDEKEPYDFKNYNKRIPSRVINLLYKTETYRTWLQMENKNINIIIVIVGIATLIILAVYGWLNFGHGHLPNIPFIGGH